MTPSFKKLYEHIQTLSPVISRAQLVPVIKEITGEDFAVQKTGWNTALVRGVFLSCRAEVPHRRTQQAGGKHVLLIARDMNRCWSRFVEVKEMMHLFDLEMEKTATGEEMEGLLGECMNPSPQRSMMMSSEVKALWMALSVLCPEKDRSRLARERDIGAISDLEIARQLKIPEQHVPALFGNRYKEILKDILGA